MKPYRSRQLGAVVLSVIVVLSVAAWWPAAAIRRPPPPPVVVASPREAGATAALAAIRQQARIKAERELDRSDTEGRRAVEHQLLAIDALFDVARSGLPRFADRVLGLGGQLALVADWLPWSRGNHARVVREAYLECVLDPERLEQAIRRSVAGTLAEFHEIDDTLLVRLRKDLDNLPAAGPIAIAGRDRFLAAVASSVEAATARSRPELERAVALEVASIAGSELLTRSVLRALASSGLIAAATASTPVSLGVGLAAGLAVDQAVSWAVDRWADPRGSLIKRLNARLAELRRMVLVGSAREPGLRPLLERLARERSAARRALILETLGATPQENIP